MTAGTPAAAASGRLVLIQPHGAYNISNEVIDFSHTPAEPPWSECAILRGDPSGLHVCSDAADTKNAYSGDDLYLYDDHGVGDGASRRLIWSGHAAPVVTGPQYAAGRVSKETAAAFLESVGALRWGTMRQLQRSAGCAVWPHHPGTPELLPDWTYLNDLCDAVIAMAGVVER